MKLQERNGEVIFFDPPNYFAIITCTIGENDFHRRMHLVNLHFIPARARFDINVLTPYFKQGIQINIDNFRRDLDDPEKVKAALARRVAKPDELTELQRLYREKLAGHGNTSRN